MVMIMIMIIPIIVLVRKFQTDLTDPISAFLYGADPVEHALLIQRFQQKLRDVIGRQTKHVLAFNVIVRNVNQSVLHGYRVFINKNILENNRKGRYINT